MSPFSVQLKIAADETAYNELQQSLSPTLYDGFSPLSDEPQPENTLYLNSVRDVSQTIQRENAISEQRIVLDLRSIEFDLSRLVIYLSPLLYRWTGQELIVVLPKEEPGAILSALSDLLRSLELRSKGIRIISCPTCARCRTNFPAMVRSIESQLRAINKPLDVAIMGCEVNGPGEARSADIGIAFGNQKGMLFRNGEKVRTVTLDEAADVLLEEISKI